jgi:hypothetical protein
MSSRGIAECASSYTVLRGMNRGTDIIDNRKVGSWHEAAVALAIQHVRYSRGDRPHPDGASWSQVDPKRPFCRLTDGVTMRR